MLRLSSHANTNCARTSNAMLCYCRISPIIALKWVKRHDYCREKANYLSSATHVFRPQRRPRRRPAHTTTPSKTIIGDLRFSIGSLPSLVVLLLLSHGRERMGNLPRATKLPVTYRTIRDEEFPVEPSRQWCFQSIHRVITLSHKTIGHTAFNMQHATN